MDEQFIDFEALSRNGLFLISGETGAGKTSVLDAMCCALYGETSGEMRGKFEKMRCKLADTTDDTLVEFVFDNNGRRYKFIRELRFARKNLNDYHNCMELSGGVFVPILENPKETTVTACAEQIIGLSVRQFRQVIILPQGQFESLLVSNSADKEKILTSIFGAEKWDKISDAISAEVRKKQNELALRYELISAILSKHGCADKDGALELCETKKSEEAKIKAELADCEKKLAALKSDYEKMLVLKQDFDNYDKRKADFDKLQNDSKAFDAEEKVLSLADAAEKLRPRYEKYEAADNKRKAAEKSYEIALKDDLEAAAALDSANKKFAELEAGRDETDKKRRRIIELEAKRDVYQKLERLFCELKDTESALSVLNAEAQKINALLENAKEKLARAKAEKDMAQSECENAENRYFKGIGGILAQKLDDGKPCPVCGSTHHPSPAKLSDGDMSKEEYERFKKLLKSKVDALDSTQSEWEKCVVSKKDADGKCSKALAEYTAAKSAYDAAIGEKAEGIDTAADLENTINKLNAETGEYDLQLKDMQDRLISAAGERTAKAERLKTECLAFENAKEEYEKELDIFRTAVDNSPFADGDELIKAMMPYEERERRKSALSEMRAAVTHAGEELAEIEKFISGKPRPDTEKQKSAIADAETNAKSMRAELVRLSSAAAILETDIKEYSLGMAKYLDDKNEADRDEDFARHISGVKGLSLKRYVLSVMMGKITVQANAILENIYGGRYRIYRTDEVAGPSRKGGLELEVLDMHNNERRSVTTLSGGEKFLVSLALAIGLSSVVQAEGKGIRLEAMFIDEGFGSLSGDALNDAMDILQGVRQMSSTVGIISHVDKLLETIPNRIEIKKGRRQSTCNVIIN